MPILASSGHDVTVYTRRRYDRRREWGAVALVPTWSLSVASVETLSSALHALIHCRLVTRPDVVSFQGVGPALLAPLARLAGFAVTVRHVGEDWRRSKWGPLGTKMIRAAEWCAARYAHVVICLSDEAADAFVRRMRPAAEVRVIRNPVHLPHAEPHDAVLDRFGLQPRRYVLATARITVEKGLDTLTDAFGRSDLHANGWRLLVAGDASSNTGYRRKIARLAAQTPGAMLAGELDAVTLADLYAYAGVFVVASQHEGMSFSLLEAMSHGLRCIVSDIPANRQTGGSVVTYFPVGDVKALAELLQAARPLSGAERAAQLDRIAQLHDPVVAARETVAAFERSLRIARPKPVARERPDAVPPRKEPGSKGTIE